jgi:trehalose 6-phosphate synthase/phosphatase
MSAERGMGGTRRSGARMTRVATSPGLWRSESRDDDRSTMQREESVSTEASLPSGRESDVHCCAHVAAQRQPWAGWQELELQWDRASLLCQLKDGLPEEMEVISIGCLKEDVDDGEQDEVAATLLENFNYVPAFLPQDLRTRFYHGFCKQMLWPLFHYLVPLNPVHGGHFNCLN